MSMPRADRLRGTRIDARQIGDGALRRVLHRDARDAAQQFVKTGVEFLSPRIHAFRTWQRVEIVALNRVYQGTRCAGRRNQVVPATRRHVRAVGQSGQPRSDWIGAVEVVQQPSIQMVGAKARLDGSHVERHDV